MAHSTYRACWKKLSPCWRGTFGSVSVGQDPRVIENIAPIPPSVNGHPIGGWVVDCDEPVPRRRWTASWGKLDPRCLRRRGSIFPKILIVAAIEAGTDIPFAAS